MTAQRLQQVALRVAIGSVLGLGLFLVLHYFTFIEELVYLEYFFIFLALAVNIIMIWRIFNHTNKHRRHKSSLRMTMGLNIVAIIGLSVAFKFMTSLLDTLRINISNASSYTLTDVKLTGCQKVRIETLKPGDTFLVTIKIRRNCSLNVLYRENGVVKTEVLSAFVSESMGQELTFKIGSH